MKSNKIIYFFSFFVFFIYLFTAPGTVRFDQAEFISSENLGVAILCASLSQSTVQNITVGVMTRDHTASGCTEHVHHGMNINVIILLFVFLFLH